MQGPKRQASEPGSEVLTNVRVAIEMVDLPIAFELLASALSKGY